MRVAIMIPVMSPAFSGAGNRGWRLARGLAQRGAEVTVITYTQGAEANRAPGVRVRVLPSWEKRKRNASSWLLRRAATLTAVFGSYREASVVLQRPRPDVLFHVGMGLAPQIVGAAAIRHGVPVVAGATLEGSDDPLTLRHTPGGRLLVGQLKRYAAIVCMSPRLLDLAVQAGLDAAKCFLIPNDVDTSTFRAVSDLQKMQLRDSLGLPSHGPILLTIGRVSARKGTRELVGAFLEGVAKRYPTATLVVLGPSDLDEGPGEYVASVHQLVAASGAAGRVRLVGEVSDTARWLQSADVFVFASRAEGFPTSLAEAVAVGLPVVARRLDGITSYILADAPIAEIVDDDVELGPAMLRAVERGREESQRARDSRAGAARFSVDSVHDAYYAVLRRVTSGQECR